MIAQAKELARAGDRVGHDQPATDLHGWEGHRAPVSAGEEVGGGLQGEAGGLVGVPRDDELVADRIDGEGRGEGRKSGDQLGRSSVIVVEGTKDIAARGLENKAEERAFD